MKDGAREVYLGMAKLFLLVGGIVAALGVADMLFGLEMFRGSPVSTSLFVLAIGGALYWTARTAPRQTEGAPTDGGQTTDVAPAATNPRRDETEAGDER